MIDPNKTVFISYRRSTSQDLARSIFMDLRANGWNAFFDVNTIDSGLFDRIILNQIAARAHFVLVLAPGSLERCANEGDWLRREIEEAMRLNRNIVPVMKEGFSFESEVRFLPKSIKDLPRFNALRIPHDYFDEGMEKLRNRFLKQPFYGEVVPTPAQEAAVVEQRISQAAGQQAEHGMSLEDYYNRASSRMVQGDVDGAIADYSELIKRDPKNAEFYQTRALLRRSKSDMDGAVADYIEAIRLDPKLVDTSNPLQEIARHAPKAVAYVYRGEERMMNLDLEGAIANYNEAIRVDPKFARAYFVRGQSRHAIGDLGGAIADYQNYLDLDGGKQDGLQETVERFIRELKNQLTNK